MNNSRICFYDNLKFVLIVLVVVGHFLVFRLGNDYATGIFLYIYSFHMPLFVFITGFFSKKIVCADNTKRLNKIFSYFIIYLIYKFALFLIINYIYHEEYVFRFFTESEAPWYLLGCIVWMVMTNIFKDIKPKYLFLFSIICFLLISYDNSIGDLLSLSRVLIFYPFYLLGYYMTKDNVEKILDVLHSKKMYLVFSVLFLCFMYFIFIFYAKDLYFLRPFFTGRNPFAYIEFPIDILCTGAVFRAFWFLYLVLISLAIFTIIPRKQTIYSEFGSRTLQVYVLHMIFVLFVIHDPIFKFLVNLFGDHVYAILIIIGVITSCLLSLKWFGKLFNKILKFDFKKLYSSD